MKHRLLAWLALPAALAAPVFAQAVAAARAAEQAQRESTAMAERVKLRQKDLDDRNDLQYAENRERCAAALKAVQQRGKVPTFACGPRGFRLKP